MRLTCRSTLILALAAALPAACGDKERKAEGDARTAAGEVRGGTISDAMLPLDAVKSQSPALKRVAAESGDTDDAGEDAEAGAQEGDAAPEAAASPEAEAD